MGIISTHQVRALQTHLLSSSSPSPSWGALEPLRAWALAMGALEARGASRAAFVAALAVSRANLGLATWEELQVYLREILWYEATHTPLFNEAVSGVLEDDARLEPQFRFFGGSRFGGYRPIQ